MARFNLAARAGIPAVRSALRFLSKLKNPPGVTVYRGQHVTNRQSLEEAKKQIPTVGRWFSDDPRLAMKFAGSGEHIPGALAIWKQMLKTGKTGYRKGIVEKT